MSKIVLGGGLSGLSCAYYLVNHLPKNDIILLESANRTGGWISTERTCDGTLYELGPRTIRPRGEAGANTLKLILNLGLENEIIPINRHHPAATNRMIYTNGKLHKLPSNLSSLFFKIPPFSKPLTMAIVKDILTPRKLSPINDESIYDFCNRRFGKEIADYIISPMICGICAGNSKEISVKFLIENLFDYEQTYGNVTRGFVMSVLKNRNKKSNENNKLFDRAIQEKWSIYSFKNGLEVLPKKLTTYLKDNNVDIKLNNCCRNIEFKNNEVVLHTNEKSYKSDHIFSCISANKLGDLIKDQHADLANLLHSIPTVDVAVLQLKFKGNLLSEPAFGYLIPPKEEIPVLGVIFDSCVKPQGNNTILTVMIGGHWFEKYLGKHPSEDMLLSITLEHLKQTLNIFDDPDYAKVNILRGCIPQYIIGHNARLKQINEYIQVKKLPLSLCGSSYKGVGINDVILSARNAVYNL